MKSLLCLLTNPGSQVKSACVITLLCGTVWLQDFPAVAHALAVSPVSPLEWLAE